MTDIRKEFADYCMLEFGRNKENVNDDLVFRWLIQQSESPSLYAYDDNTWLEHLVFNYKQFM